MNIATDHLATQTAAPQLALFSGGDAGDFNTAAEMGFTHALLRDASLLPDAARAGLHPVLELDHAENEAENGRLAALQAAGAAGFYFREAHKTSGPFWRPVLEALRARAADVLLIADILGAAPGTIAELAGAGFDFATSSFCYWDYRAGWLAADTARTESVAAALVFATLPGSLGDTGAARQRALYASAMFAPAWCVDKALLADKSDEIRALLTMRRQPALQTAAAARVVSPPGAALAILARGTFAAIVNPSLTRETVQPAATFLPLLAAGALRHAGREDLTPGAALAMAPGAVEFFDIAASPPITLPPPRLDTKAQRIAIEQVSPAVDNGLFPARRVLGETAAVEADLICDGHEQLAAQIMFRGMGEKIWQSVPMRKLGNDRWGGEVPLTRLGQHRFMICAWLDRFASFADALRKKHDAGQTLALELREGMALVEEAAQAKAHMRGLAALLAALPEAELLEKLLDAQLGKKISDALPRKFLSKSAEFPLEVEPYKARFASWYEIFPRSQAGDGKRHGNFDDVVAQLPRIAAMGFDVLYFPPIHPIGQANRKGRNNSLRAAPDDPGSPYAIGAAAGGHDAVHPELGTLDDFCALVAAAKPHGLDIALDFAIQCSPDHPWLREHKDWFDWRADGSLRYAENPPKKYEDIVNVDFYAGGGQPDLWCALRDVVQFWVDQGVRYFRVDNPHTKPLPFWEWLIADIRSRHADVVFLAEAFTRPKVMYRLAKIGFSQSYSYFTWRNSKQELTDYLTELVEGPAREFFRPHFFVNTPDINPEFLQTSGRAGFLIRAALAACLSGLFGVYNGFELCEARAVPGKEEYLDSEKYELKAWDNEKPGNIIAEITALNEVRKQNSALHSHLGLEFLACDNAQILYFRKYAADGNILLIAISLDPFVAQNGTIELPLWRFGLSDDGALAAEDLVRGTAFVWHGKYQPVHLNPHELPYCIWRVEPAAERAA